MVRIKHRYLLLNILYPDPASLKIAPNTPDILKFHAPTPDVTPQTFLAHLRSHITASFGDQGLGLCSTGLKIVYFSNATSTVILRVPRSHHHIVWATLTYMNELPPPPRGVRSAGPKCVIRVVRVSGTIRKIEEEMLRRGRQHIVQAKLAGMDVQDAVLDRLAGGNENMSMSIDDADSTSEG